MRSRSSRRSRADPPRLRAACSGGCPPSAPHWLMFAAAAVREPPVLFALAASRLTPSGPPRGGIRPPQWWEGRQTAGGIGRVPPSRGALSAFEARNGEMRAISDIGDPRLVKALAHP